MPEISNPSLFREMSEPFDTAEEADDALQAFGTELQALREKHKITNLYAVINISYKLAGGEEVESMGTASFGMSSKWESMTAWAFGKASTEREQHIAKMLAQGRSHKNR